MNSKNDWFKLKKLSIISLFVYYILLLSISAYLLIMQLWNININEANIFKNSLINALVASVLGAAVFYIRKLYKACINLDIVEPQDQKDTIREIGVFFYFLLRPAFSAVFSIVVVILLKSGIGILSTSKIVTHEFYYIITIVCFFIGYSVGDVVDKFEEVGKNIATKISEFKI